MSLRAVALGVCVVLSVGACGAGLPEPPPASSTRETTPDACTGIGARRGALWNEDLEAELRERVASTDGAGPVLADRLTRAQRRLVERWERGMRRACEGARGGDRRAMLACLSEVALDAEAITETIRTGAPWQLREVSLPISEAGVDAADCEFGFRWLVHRELGGELSGDDSVARRLAEVRVAARVGGPPQEAAAAAAVGAAEATGDERWIADARTWSGWVMLRRDRMDEATERLEAAREAWIAAGSEAGALRAQTGLARVLERRGLAEEALAVQREIMEERARMRHRGLVVHATDRAARARLLLAVRRPVSAAADAREALAIDRALLSSHDRVARDHQVLGIALWDLSRIDESLGALRTAERMRRVNLGGGHSTLAHVLEDLALIHRGEGDYGAAEDALERALAIVEGLPHARARDVAWLHVQLGAVRRLRGSLEEAIRAMRRAEEAYRAMEEPDGAALARLRLGLGQTLLRRELFEEALASLELAAEGIDDGDVPARAALAMGRGRALRGLERHGEAVEAFAEARDRFAELPTPDPPSVLRARLELARAHRAAGDRRSWARELSVLRRDAREALSEEDPLRVEIESARREGRRRP